MVNETWDVVCWSRVTEHCCKVDVDPRIKNLTGAILKQETQAFLRWIILYKSKIWKAITFLCCYLSLRGVVSSLCGLVSSLCDLVSSLCLVVTSLCFVVTSLCFVVTSLCFVVTSLCHVVTSLCLVLTSLCLVVASLCLVVTSLCGLFIMWCGFVFMFCSLHFRYEALIPRLYSLLGTSQTGFKTGPSSCSFALSKITKRREQATIHLVGPGSGEFVRKPLARGGEFVNFSRRG